MSTPQIESSWLNVLQSEFEEDYMQELRTFLRQEMRSGHTYIPSYGSTIHSILEYPLSGCKGCHSRSGPISWSKAGNISKFLCSTGNTSTTFFKKIYTKNAKLIWESYQQSMVIYRSGVREVSFTQHSINSPSKICRFSSRKGLGTLYGSRYF